MKHLIIILLGLFTTLNAWAQESWTLQKDKNGIKVYTKQEGDAKLKSSKAVMEVNTSIERILEVLADIPNYTVWTPKTKSAKMLDVISANEYYYYTVVSAPMVSNRDMVVHVKIYKNSKGETIVDMNGKPNYIPEEEDLVRMPMYKGVYTLKDLGNGKVKMTLEYSTDPGGKLPDWLVNTAAVDVPFDIFTNLKEIF